MGAGPQQQHPKIVLSRLLDLYQGVELAPGQPASVEPNSPGQPPTVVTVSLGEAIDGVIELGHYQFPNPFRAGGFARDLQKYEAEMLSSGVGLERGVSARKGDGLNLVPWHPVQYNKKYHSND